MLLLCPLCDVNFAAWRCFYFDQQQVHESDVRFYAAADTGFGPYGWADQGTRPPAEARSGTKLGS
jgi:hypothetical protein